MQHVHVIVFRYQPRFSLETIQLKDSWRRKFFVSLKLEWNIWGNCESLDVPYDYMNQRKYQTVLLSSAL